MRKPNFTFEDIKYGVDTPTLKKVIQVYNSGKVTNFKELPSEYFATVLSTYPYDVSVGFFEYDFAECTCYIGKQGDLCKHMVAVALYALLRLSRKLSDGGVDDSDGTVGDFLDDVVGILEQFAEKDPSCVKAFEKLKG